MEGFSIQGNAERYSYFEVGLDLTRLEKLNGAVYDLDQGVDPNHDMLVINRTIYKRRPEADEPHVGTMRSSNGPLMVIFLAAARQHYR